MSKIINLRKRKNLTKHVIHKDRKKINLNQIYSEKYKLLLLIISILSILFGAICYKNLDNIQLTQAITESFKTLISSDLKSIFMYLFKLDIVYFLICFFIGTSFIGSILTFIPPAIKCLYIGYLGGYLYNEFELKGVLFCLLLLYPCFVITTTALIFASNENVYMSKYICNCLNGRNSTDNISLKLYLLRYILLFTITVACITITTFLITFISPKLNIM